MPTTRKKVIKTVFKDEEDSEVEEAFSDSGSEAQISDESSSEDEIDEPAASSGDEFAKTKKPKQTHTRVMKRTKFAKSFINKINKQMSLSEDADEIVPAVFSIKDMTDEDKLLPSVLNLSESDSSDDESEMAPPKLSTTKTMYAQSRDSGSEDDDKDEYKDVWSNNVNDESEEIARKAFMELEQHKSKLEETKASIHQYSSKIQKNDDYDVKDLLAQGEEVLPKQPTPKKKIKSRKAKDESDSDMDDWEEVRESKSIPQQGLQLIVDLPNSVCRKTKKIDVEMMMKRKINRVKKEYQVYMHKVHVLCWLGHGNYVSKVLNDQELLAASLTLVPSKVCYPGERVDMKYIEQITTWYKDKLTLKQDKNENKYKPKAPPLKDLLISQIKSRVVTTRKYLVYIFVCLLRALGLQCRVMFNFVTLPIKPPNSELCSLSTKPKDEKVGNKENPKETNKRSVSKSSTGKKNVLKKSVPKEKISQVDGTDEEKTNYLNCLKIAQLDGNDDILQKQTRSSRIRKTNVINNGENDVSPPKRSKQIPKSKTTKNVIKSTTENDHKQGYNTSTNKIENSEIKGKVNTNENALKLSSFIDKSTRNNKKSVIENKVIKTISKAALKADESKNELSTNTSEDMIIPRKTRSDLAKANNTKKTNLLKNPPKIVITEMESNNSSKYFNETKSSQESIKLNNTRKRSRTATPNDTKNEKEIKNKLNTQRSTKTRTKSAPCPSEESKYFIKDKGTPPNQCKKPKVSLAKHKTSEDLNRVSHRDLAKTREKSTKNDVTGDLVGLIKGRIKEAKEESKKGIVKGKMKKESDNDSDYLPEEDSLPNKFADSDDDFKPSKISPKPSTSKITKIDRRVLSSDEDIPKNKVDVWCEVFVEELEQWIPVDVVKGRVHCAENIYSNATHPVCYIVGWDNNNYLKDLTRRYVPHWNTATRKQRAEPAWWNKAVELWLGPKNARDREEDEQLDRMQLEAPLPKSIAEYKNHPLYALKRHLLKYEALYPPDAAILGFVRQEPVYARECVYVCRSRDTWLKEAKVVKLREQPYKVVKARPKWDKLSNKLITDKPLEIFGPWQVQDYEPPVAENGVVPRNAYGNVELFKDCMLPKGTVHIKLPGLNKVAKKLNIDCAPAMTGFDFNGGWSHPVYDGFIVCKEFEEIITEAWLKDQEDQERREIEKTEARVYGNWRRLIRGLWVRERLKDKYGFEEPSTSQDCKKSKGPRLVVKKK